LHDALPPPVEGKPKSAAAKPAKRHGKRG
jgi:hypothetical protein